LLRYARNDVKLLVLAFVALACSGCNVIEQPQGMIPRWTTAWREAATDSDKARLRDWRATFVAALTAARKAGHSAEIAREGALLDPDSALGGGPIPNGRYRCRVIKLGAKAPGNLDYVSYPGFTCRVAAERSLQQLDKLNGSQRYDGLIFPGDAVRQVFLGTLVLGDETRALQYGQDATRDVAGYVERIGANRWRLIMPKPHFESQLDVLELVPLTK
jgi:hypothetical protein